MLRVIVIDDHEQFAEVVRATMNSEPDFEAIGHATNVPDGLALIDTFEPDLVAVNVHVGRGEGITSIAQITAADWWLSTGRLLEASAAAITCLRYCSRRSRRSHSFATT